MKVLLVLVASLIMIQAFEADHITDAGKDGKINTQSKSDILDSVQQVIYDLLQNATELLNSIRSALTKILGSTLRLLTGLLKDAENLLLTIADEILHQIHQVNEIDLPCVANQEQNVEQILAAARDDIHICVGTAYETIENIHNRTIPFETDVVNEINKIKQLFSLCFNINPIEIMECVIGEVNEIGDTLLQIEFTAKQALKLISNEANLLVETTSSCINSVIKVAQNQLDAISKEIIDCIESQKPN